MISLILPYWNRQEAADQALALLEKHYSGIEVIIIDDGNRVPYKLPETRLNVRVIRTPVKDKPTSPLAAWNLGVKEAKGDVIALSCIEILHESPVLGEMYSELMKQGKDGYILAAAWCPEFENWHCHSTVEVPECPPGSGIGFLSMMHRELFNRAGGFDPDYMAGAGYEDRDFIHRLHSVGAKFVIRDDLVVVHPKTGAHIAWEPEGFIRNEALFHSKWGIVPQTPVTFVCLKAGTAYGAEYVNILRDMVARNLPSGFRGRFVCITDDSDGIDPGIEILPLPDDLETWWGKLYMFKRGLFKEGERCFFFDLDTLILGRLDEIVKYSGKFATLRDFYSPQQVGPAIISWEVGEFSYSIWDEWVIQNKPRNAMGDLWWLNNLDQGRFVKKIDIFQDLFPGSFVSFKADCHPYPPKGAAVVCFHGQPKPSNCCVDWVDNCWRIGGGGNADLEAIANTNNEVVKRNVLSACERQIQWLEIKEPHDGNAILVAGAPSLKDNLEEIRWRVSIGQKVIACNGAAKYLKDNGIEPDAQIIIDARAHNAEFLCGVENTYLASQCDASLFDKAKGVVLFHLNTKGVADILPTDREAHLISSGTTVGLAAMAVAYTQGYRKLHLYGYDSSYEESHHAYDQHRNDVDSVIEAVVDGRKFKCAPWMVIQVQQFQELAVQLVDDGVVITVTGDGLLPFVAKKMFQNA